MGNVEFLKKIKEIGYMFDAGCEISISADNDIFCITGYDYDPNDNGDKEPNAYITYIYDVDLKTDDDDNIVDTLTPVLQQIIKDRDKRFTEAMKRKNGITE